MQKATALHSAQPIVHINTFGAFVRYLREREQISQSELVETFDYFFEEYDQASLTADMYRKLEKGKRAAQYEELLPLYAALIGNNFKISPQERNTYVRLARLKLEGLQRKKPKVRSDSDWRALEVQLAQIDQNGQTLQEIEKTRGNQTQRKSLLDVSHIVGRTSWLTQMLSYLDAKKLVVIQGMMGIGKTSGLKVLLHALLEREEYQPIFYTFSTATDITPKDHLEAFLATVLAELQIPELEASKTPPLSKRIEQLMKHLVDTQQHIILLIDDAQVILDTHGQLPSEWHQFFAEYLRADHKALVYLTTREWPHWTGRERSFVVDGDEVVLPPLDQQVGMDIWKNLGFTNVSDDLLRQATERCGGNPLVIEMRAANLQRPRFSFAWQRSKIHREKKNEQQQLIEQLLTEPYIFGSADVEVRQLLQQVIGRRLSHDALQVLEALAVSPIALPLPLLLEINLQAEYAFAELLQASLIDRNALQDERAALQPLAREAVVHRLLLEKRFVTTERHLIHAYITWLTQGTFLSEQEQATTVSELVIAYLKQHQLLEAAELLIEYGWLSFAFGHAPRLARIADEVMRVSNWHQSTRFEAGGLLLQYDLLARALDKDLSNAERKKAYLYLYDVMIDNRVDFRPRTIVYLVHHKLRYLISAKQYSEAWTLIDAACRQHEELQYTKPITYAELLDRRAYVLGRWGDYQDTQVKMEQDTEEAKKVQEEAHMHWQEAVVVHQQCIEMLRRAERFSSPVEQSHIRFKRARLLNDLAYYRRCLGQLEEAKQAMSECLQLKEAGYVWANSLAVSYGDYGQLLGQLGYYQEALTYSDRALQIVQKIISDGDITSLQEKGMQLVDKGKLLLLLGHLDEAKAHFDEGSVLVEATSRSVYKDHADVGLQLIKSWYETNPYHQLDWRWFPRYHQLVSYDDILWLSQAGPFSTEESQEWQRLIARREEKGIAKQLSAILTQSRKRELTSCLAEQREPHFHYPLIPYEEVQSKLIGLSFLRTEIEQYEPNAIVRRFYTDTIDERVDELKLVESTYRGDDESFWVQSQRLAEKTSLSEMQIALNQLLHRIRQGYKCAHTQEISTILFQKLQQWHLLTLAQDFKASDYEQIAVINAEKSTSTTTFVSQAFPRQVVQRFFEEVFKEYKFDWTVVVDSAATSERVDLNNNRLILTDRPMSSTKIRELLAHEIEVHTFRSASGSKSPLSILSSGLRNYLSTEEGLATFYTEKAVQQGTGTTPKPKLWIGTLACGLASGIACTPLSFSELFVFIEAVSLLIDLLDKKDTSLTQLQEKARRYAENRCLRTWRGVTNLNHRGICSNKDTYYLRGYLNVRQELEREPNSFAQLFDQLMVGSVGLQHLSDLRQLGITVPNVVHKHLAMNPNLDDYISQCVKLSLSEA